MFQTHEVVRIFYSKTESAEQLGFTDVLQKLKLLEGDTAETQDLVWWFDNNQKFLKKTQHKAPDNELRNHRINLGLKRPSDYQVQALTWSPESHHWTTALGTTSVSVLQKVWCMLSLNKISCFIEAFH